MVLERIRRLLGAEVPRERFSWWPLGLAALVVPALLMFSALSAKEAPPAEKPGDRTPTLAEIAKANDAAWAAIRSVDMEYETTSELFVGGKKVREVRCPGQRWTKQGDRERDHGRSGGLNHWDTDAHVRGDFKNAFRPEFRVGDWYSDGTNVYQWYREDGPERNDGPCATIDPRRPEMGRKLGLLQSIRHRSRTMTLPELIAAGGVTIRGKQKSKDGDTLWLLEADDPATYSEDGTGARNKNPPTCTRIYVNADKGFLINRIAYNVSLLSG
jgi:hypothetical protein